jgi:hypothetical protein
MPIHNMLKHIIYDDMDVRCSLKGSKDLNHSKLAFHLKLKVFPHDFTPKASVMGNSVMGHCIGGKDIPAKVMQLAKSHSLE